MMVKEDPIKLEKKKNLEKKRVKENSVTIDKPVDRTQWAVDRPVDRTIQRRNAAQSVDRLSYLSKGTRACR